MTQVAFLCEDSTQHMHADIEVTPDLAWWQRLFSIQPRAQIVNSTSTHGKQLMAVEGGGGAALLLTKPMESW